MNKNLSFLGLFLLGILLAGILTIIPQRSAYAKCYDPQTQQPIPCPNNNSNNDPNKSDYSKKNQATAVPSKTPTPTPTDTPKPAVVVDQPLNPNASCPPAPAAAASNTTPPSPALSSFFDIPPLLLGGGGTLLGILIGLLLGGVFFRNRVNGDGNRGWNGPITAPGELLPAIQKADKFEKSMGNANGGGIFTPVNGDGKILPFIEKAQKADADMSSGGNNFIKGEAEPAGFDVFHKQGDIAGAYDAFAKFDKPDSGLSNNMGKQDLNSIRESPLSGDKSSLPGEDINGDLKI